MTEKGYLVTQVDPRDQLLDKTKVFTGEDYTLRAEAYFMELIQDLSIITPKEWDIDEALLEGIFEDSETGILIILELIEIEY